MLLLYKNLNREEAATTTEAEIGARKQIAIIAAKAFIIGNATSFNKSGKYIWINDDTACAWEGGKNGAD